MTAPTQKMRDAWTKYMHSTPGQHVRNMLGDYFKAAMEVRDLADELTKRLKETLSYAELHATMAEQNNDPGTAKRAWKVVEDARKALEWANEGKRA